ncbi:TetR/AcrR family transcriptional regulator [Falsibacillus albus]|uniref:TetR family transcriptional regulator n=1 Tax=Falsibacillus albus TaxID=2478915 RepID=A0A3L7JN64_9BACI|nr:TetR/AcrR family transcriptional regulator [Falsibacillus albus]RLQ92268.1 TetR family transcriptional regulator [Falsibacillus albus]
MPRAGLDEATVLQAAMEIADEQGLDALVLAKLAKKLGVRTPSLYNHIDGLMGLRKKLTVYGLESLSESLTQSAVGKSKEDAVRSLAEAFIHFARRHPGLYEAAERSPHWDGEEIQTASKKVLDPIIQVFQAFGIENEGLQVHLIRGFRSLVHGFASIEQQGGFGMPVEVDESFQVVIDTYLDGIKSTVEAHKKE